MKPYTFILLAIFSLLYLYLMPSQYPYFCGGWAAVIVYTLIEKLK